MGVPSPRRRSLTRLSPAGGGGGGRGGGGRHGPRWPSLRGPRWRVKDVGPRGGLHHSPGLPGPGHPGCGLCRPIGGRLLLCQVRRVGSGLAQGGLDRNGGWGGGGTGPEGAFMGDGQEVGVDGEGPGGGCHGVRSRPTARSQGVPIRGAGPGVWASLEPRACCLGPRVPGCVLGGQLGRPAWRGRCVSPGEAVGGSGASCRPVDHGAGGGEEPSGGPSPRSSPTR